MTPRRGEAPAEADAIAQTHGPPSRRQLTRDDIAELSTAELDGIFYERRRRHEARAADPELRACVLRRAKEAETDGRLTLEEAAAIRRSLDEVAPATVLEAWWRQLILNVRFTGAFPRRADPRAAAALPDEWLRADPRRLANVVAEMRRFAPTDLPKVVKAALALADRVGIDPDIADRVICAALREQPAEVSHVG
ncbi:MAG TPA: hypothetical protein VMU75_08640 [Acidimicrobiales bacterium]|nr:hypothetical protein [Acidimicrobiales bacterium]